MSAFKRPVAAALLVGLIAITAALALVLGGSPPGVLATNGIAVHEELASSSAGGGRICQGGESLPAGTQQIQVSIDAFTGPPIALQALVAGRVLTSGTHASAWTGEGVAIGVKPLQRTTAGVTLCISTKPIHEELTFYGSHTKPSIAARNEEGKPLPGRLRVLYLGRGQESWFDRASSVVGHMAFGRTLSGTLVVLLVVALMLSALAGASLLILRELDV